jgi:serine/threonine protein kinase
VKKIGKGNFAAVYLATRLRDGTKVAVKAFSKEHIFSQEKGRESLINEIKLLRSFNHPNILRLMSVYESLNSVYLVMEHLEGSQLFNVIESHHFTLKEIQDLMRGLLSAAAEFARKNVVHRDLKPENIMFRTNRINSEIVVLDFGLSTFCDEKDYIYTRCGTPGFVAPEIVNIKDLTTKCRPISDVFSLGVILHILLLGKSPFKGKTFNEVLSENRQCSFTLQGPEYNALPA